MLAAFPALGASEYEQGFDFSLSSPQNLNTFLFSSGIPSWPVFNFQPRNVTLLKFVEIPAFFGIFINSLPLRLDKGNAMTQQAQIRKSIWVWCGWSAVSCSPINCRFPKKEVLPFSLCWNCISALPLNSPIIWTNRAELTLLCILSPQQCDYNFCKCFFLQQTYLSHAMPMKGHNCALFFSSAGQLQLLENKRIQNLKFKSKILRQRQTGWDRAMR